MPRSSQAGEQRADVEFGRDRPIAGDARARVDAQFRQPARQMRMHRERGVRPLLLVGDQAKRPHALAQTPLLLGDGLIALHW